MAVGKYSKCHICHYYFAKLYPCWQSFLCFHSDNSSLLTLLLDHPGYSSTKDVVGLSWRSFSCPFKFLLILWNRSHSPGLDRDQNSELAQIALKHFGRQLTDFFCAAHSNTSPPLTDQIRRDNFQKYYKRHLEICPKHTKLCRSTVTSRMTPGHTQQQNGSENKWKVEIRRSLQQICWCLNWGEHRGTLIFSRCLKGGGRGYGAYFRPLGPNCRTPLGHNCPVWQSFRPEFISSSLKNFLECPFLAPDIFSIGQTKTLTISWCISFYFDRYLEVSREIFDKEGKLK